MRLLVPSVPPNTVIGQPYPQGAVNGWEERDNKFMIDEIRIIKAENGHKIKVRDRHNVNQLWEEKDYVFESLDSTIKFISEKLLETEEPNNLI